MLLKTEDQVMREFTVDRFDVAAARTETTRFDDEHAALWFAVELSAYQTEGNWICVYNWNGSPNYPNALPAIRWSCSALRCVEQGAIRYANIHG